MMEAHGLDRFSVPVMALEAQYIFDQERSGLEDDPQVALAALAKTGLLFQASPSRRGRLGEDWHPYTLSTPFSWACTEYNLTGEDRLTQGSIPTKYRYTGQYDYQSEIGLYFYGARWYDSSLGRFAQADTVVPGAGNPLAWDRYAYGLNNPVRYVDPTGHRTCENEDDGDCSGGGGAYFGMTFEDRIPIIASNFNITFKGGWSWQNMLIIMKAVLAVGAAFASAAASNSIYMTAAEAFNAVYGYVNFVWKGNGHVGGKTPDAHNIEFTGLYRSSVLSSRLAVHELGHAFDQVIGNERGGNQWTKGIRTDLTGKMGLCADSQSCLGRKGHEGDPNEDNPFWGFAGGWEEWQFGASDWPGEVFADMFVGWTYGQWGGDTRGTNRQAYMNTYMPSYIWFALGH
jgi:RHS repeat-associated protein